MPFTTYLELLIREPRFLAFGFLAAFASSFGQTFFIGTFGPGIQEEFSLSHTAWGTVYMIGTTASALLLPWTGKQIDRVDLRLFLTGSLLLLAFACVFIAWNTSAALLIVAIFLLRHGGQGLMSHTAVTSMARYFDRDRGRAIAIGGVGFAAGEAILPFLAVIAIAWFGWRNSYAAGAALLLFVVFPCLLWCAGKHELRHANYLRRLNDPASDDRVANRSWMTREVLRDKRFYLLMPGLMAPSLIGTALFFHHLNIADEKGWTHAWITGNYVVYAVCITLMSLWAGTLIDRYGAVRIMPMMLLPLTFALMILWSVDEKWIVLPYFLLLGVNVGIAMTAVTAMWAEIYGVAHLGAIKSLAHSISVFASALGPVAMGALADAGMLLNDVCLVFAGYALIGAILMRHALRQFSSPAPAANAD